jgi:hypothetical protein
MRSSRRGHRDMEGCEEEDACMRSSIRGHRTCDPHSPWLGQNVRKMVFVFTCEGGLWILVGKNFHLLAQDSTHDSGRMNYVLFKGPNDDDIPFIRSTLAGEPLTFFGEYRKNYCQVFDLCFIVNCKIGTIAPGSLTPAFFLVLTSDIFAMTDLMGKANLEEWLANNPDKQPCELLGTPFFDNKIYPITVLREK